MLTAAKPFRWTHIRTVEPPIPRNRTVRKLFSLWWAALAAAGVSMQSEPLLPAKLRLFSAQLSSADNVRLRWGGDFGDSAELRRAYSARYGRYFSRALFASRLGFTDFVPLRTNITRLPNGVARSRCRCFGIHLATAAPFPRGREKSTPTGSGIDGLSTLRLVWGVSGCLDLRGEPAGR